VLQGLQPVLLIGELLRVALRESAFLGASLESLQIFAQALLVVVNLLGFIVAAGSFFVEDRNAALLLDDFTERRFDLRSD